MNKKGYKLTPNDYGFKVEVWDEFGAKTTVYERNVYTASEFIIYWWMDSSKRKKQNDLLNKAIYESIQRNKSNGILTGNRDGLD